ncbi:MAG TPA: hypothetical protein VLG16_02240 [Candidatus Saccharimonadales bacterium]|nr:hypothetical protein [Candidatus Saccharimonadales bacterium]
MSSPDQPHPYIHGPSAPYTWSARFSFEEQPRSLEDIITQLGGIATEFNSPDWPISGAVLGTGDAEDRAEVVLGLDPSQRFGTPSIRDCELIADIITETQGWRRKPEVPAEMRIIMGRRIGYDGAVYSMQEVSNLLAGVEADGLELTEANLFSLRYNSRLEKYQEPAVIVAGAEALLDPVLKVAAMMGQDRLVPEITNVATIVYHQKKDKP